MRGKLGLSLGFIVTALWSLPAFAEDAAPAAAPAAPGPLEKSGTSSPETTAVPPKHTVLLGFQAIGHPARLQSNWHPDSTSTGWYTVCIAPCTRRVAAEASFRVAGANFDASEPFQLPKQQDHVVATSTLMKKSLALPAWMIAGGYTSMVLIGPYLFLAGFVRSEAGEPGGDAMLVTGLGLAAAGAVVGTVGVIMLIIRAGEKQSLVKVEGRPSARLKLPGGLALEPSGLKF